MFIQEHLALKNSRGCEISGKLTKDILVL